MTDTDEKDPPSEAELAQLELHAREVIAADADYGDPSAEWSSVLALVGEVRSLRREVSALRACWHQSEPWPLRDVLERLIVGANHLLIDHACDEHGYEQLNAARDAGKEILADLDALPPRPAPAGDARAGQSPEVKLWVCNACDGVAPSKKPTDHCDVPHSETDCSGQWVAALDAAAQAPGRGGEL